MRTLTCVSFFLSALFCCGEGSFCGVGAHLCPFFLSLFTILPFFFFFFALQKLEKSWLSYLKGQVGCFVWWIKTSPIRKMSPRVSLIQVIYYYN